MLHYVPLEPYQERYTAQLSRADTGWLEAKWKKHGVEYFRIEGPLPVTDDAPNEIKVGRVLDANRSSTRCARSCG